MKRICAISICVAFALSLAACDSQPVTSDDSDAQESQSTVVTTASHESQQTIDTEESQKQESQQTDNPEVSRENQQMEEAKEPTRPYTATENFDYEALGIKEYEYPQEFSMGDNLQMAVGQLALIYENFNRNLVSDENWMETFIANFIQNSRLSFEYLDAVSDKKNGEIGIDELNYIQYSLTGVYLDFSSYAGESVNRNNSASSLNHGAISNWNYEYKGNEVIITADFEIGFDGTDFTQERELTVNLVRNPYSCFDGYSIVSISSKNVETDFPALEDSAYVGEYLDKDNNDPNLEIAKSEDGHYIVQIGIYRLTTLSDGVGELTADGMSFRATDASGNPISGMITVDGEIATVTFTDSTWEYLPNGTAFQYMKSSDIPNVWK